MIQPLRTVHRRAFVALAFVLPGLLVAGLSARRPPLRTSSQHDLMPETAYVLRQSGRLWEKHTVQSKFYGDPARPKDVFVMLQPEHPLVGPDLLLYWSESSVQGNALPPSAQLIGAFVPGRAVAMPAGSRAGHLVLYSLAHQEVVDSAQVEQLP